MCTYMTVLYLSALCQLVASSVLWELAPSDHKVSLETVPFLVSSIKVSLETVPFLASIIKVSLDNTRFGCQSYYFPCEQHHM